MGVPGPMGTGDFWGSKPQSKHAISNCRCHLANTNEELGGLAAAIPPFAKLLWSLLFITPGAATALHDDVTMT